MNLHGFLTSILSNSILIPTAVLCFAPMKGLLKKSVRYSVIRISLITVAVIGLFSFLESYYSISYNALILPFFLVTFSAFHTSLTIPLYKSLFIYTMVFTLMSFISNFASGFDAMLHPEGTISNFSMEAIIFQAILAVGSCCLLVYPLYRFGGRLMKEFDIPRIYIITIPIWCIFLGFNILITPRKYETLHVNLMKFVYWGSLSLFLLLFFLLCILFYLIVTDMKNASETREKARILEMQESAFVAQQRYMNETSKVRHDFKHTIGALSMLINDGDYTAAKFYLNEYLTNQPQNETLMFCDNLPVNALLNYYNQIAKNERINIEIEVSLPDPLKVSDIDLCNILGNILENAILACESLAEDRRFIDVAIRHENEVMLYIVATNSFDGMANMNGEAYVSTRRTGSGIGLRSIKETAEKYGGSVRFSHQGTEFYTDVVLPI